jgi:hypothetical protein
MPIRRKCIDQGTQSGTQTDLEGNFPLKHTVVLSLLYRHEIKELKQQHRR